MNDGLKEILAQLDKALAPRPPIDWAAEFERQVMTKTTSLKVYHGDEQVPA